MRGAKQQLHVQANKLSHNFIKPSVAMLRSKQTYRAMQLTVLLTPEQAETLRSQDAILV